MSVQFLSYFSRIFVFSLLAIASIQLSAQEPKIGQITGGAAYEIPAWFTDSFLEISDDVEDASDENKSVLLYFHLDGCPYCDAMLVQNFKSGDNLAFIQKHFSAIAVNLKGDREITMTEDETLLEKELSQKLKVQYTPTIIFIGEDGKQVFRTNGYRTPKAFRHVLEYVVSQSYKNSTLSDYVESSEKSTKGYTFIDYPSLEKVSYLQDYKQPVAILFEDKDCIDCKNFHEKLINRDDVKPNYPNICSFALMHILIKKLLILMVRLPRQGNWLKILTLIIALGFCCLMRVKISPKLMVSYTASISIPYCAM